MQAESAGRAVLSALRTSLQHTVLTGMAKPEEHSGNSCQEWGLSMTAVTDASHDFDFEVGSWTVRHRRLKERLTGCDDWEAFAGTSETRLVLGGTGNVEDNVLALPGGTCRAIAVRSFDVASGTWAIWWLSTDRPHALDIPVIGRFEDGVGAFYADDTLRGAPVQVRFLWLKTDSPAPRWEQAMSDDGGTTWETNWTMDFERSKGLKAGSG